MFTTEGWHKQNQTIHTYGQLRLTDWPFFPCMSLDCGRKSGENPCRQHANSQPGLEPRTFLLRQSLHHRAATVSKEIGETNKIGLRTVQHIIKTWKGHGEPSTSRDHLNIWWNQIVESTESSQIGTKQLCSLKKTLLSEARWKRKASVLCGA